ncbi:hypothetical protein Dalk_4156 [Desulfatibacillum aliphaticivorans]|uniref:Acetoacetate decarboxylase n=1 Tax=Desulfatibacillum aliphaticivorans TaxID=218208 RepID=B8FMX0_DESAL|nr:acetoacetate decarboxylase family protein [Desulfatibacillum aliphaticivorans]ACL05840.1 hypothetical protein Dalk_4156 [Desulfatibacillum aliphaticivorans]
MKISEKEYQEFFKDLEFRNTAVPSTGELFQMPLVGEKAIQMAAFYTASRSKVMDILPIPELVPVELPNNQTILGIVAIEYHKRNIPNYSEVVVIVPVKIGESVAPPTLEDLMEEGFGGCTLFVRHIAVNTRIATIVGNELLGYSKFQADIRFVNMPEERICVLEDGGEEILTFSVNSKVEEWGDWERNTMSVCTYKNDRIYRLTYKSQTRVAADHQPKGALVFGPHSLGKILDGLDVAKQPVMTLFSPYFQLISDDNNLEVFKP